MSLFIFITTEVHISLGGGNVVLDKGDPMRHCYFPSI